MKKTYKILICSIIICIVLGCLLFIQLKNNDYSKEEVVNLQTMMMSATKNETKSEFDEWLLNDLGVKYVPSYIIIDGYDIVGIIDGGNGVDTFKKNYKEVLKNHEVLANLKDVEDTYVYIPYQDTITKLTYELEENRVTIIEVHKISCNDCKIADGVIGEYEIYEFDDDGAPIEGTKTILKIDGKKVYETVQIHRAIKDATFYRYYIKSDIEEIFERYNET